ncbi:hypothetical protein CFC21_012911 [Triticum aestivum]|uniref:PGG domain-containing protein n=3 Tax=Triticinae TaxID=1648030 RepID=A0A3B5ZZN0_WHEAT|nr:uncharacterized protein LOC109746231 [Aegilops tauschii subsp. strangulata]XP_044445000.1 uncharacterized protein LOC123171943 [Triticum aestivum]KAF6996592.1 hypothetical protein CFC21_012911 [Triticum aestivum]
MESPQKKAASMDGSKSKTTAHLLPVTVAKKTPRPDHVRWVSAWALFTASVFAFSFAVGSAIAYALDHFHVACSQSSFFLRCDQLTDAAEAVVNALGTGMLCCAALQAAAAVLALRLRCRRRSLAYLALALTIGGHCIYAAIAHLLLVADPGDLFFGISFAVSIVFFAAGDIISFVSLLRGGEDEE